MSYSDLSPIDAGLLGAVIALFFICIIESSRADSLRRRVEKLQEIVYEFMKHRP